MITHNIQIAKGFRWLGALMGVSFLALAACTQMEQPAASTQPAKAYVSNFKDNTVSVINTDAGKVVATVPVAAGPHGMAVSPDGRNVYVSGDLASTVSVIDTTSDRVAHTIEVGKAPHGVAMKSDGKLLLVAVYGDDRVAFVDTCTRAVSV